WRLAADQMCETISAREGVASRYQTVRDNGDLPAEGVAVFETELDRILRPSERDDPCGAADLRTKSHCLAREPFAAIRAGDAFGVADGDPEGLLNDGDGRVSREPLEHIGDIGFSVFVDQRRIVKDTHVEHHSCGRDQIRCGILRLFYDSREGSVGGEFDDAE